MNPDAVLDEARTALKDWEHADIHSHEEWEAAERLSSAVGALDDWLSRGGALPQDWLLPSLVP